ncbi:hypothetical protein FQN50_002160 [Emmonsiellopsis sp. PD_5]|nr:hypothetical protein FQN50_002160 [Emmonsiellopsis sp. PD_5]
MLQPRLRTPLRALDSVFTPSVLRTQQPKRSQSHLFQPRRTIPSTTTITSPSSILHRQHQFSLLPRPQVRHASHNAQGRANNGTKNGAGRRLGAKKSGDQYVVPGNIIFRQRGSKWFPGDNCGMGRDHTIYSLATGYVRYYLDPARHPNRKYIGVVFDKADKLPAPRNAVTRRRLGMVAVPRNVEQEEENKRVLEAEPTPVLRPGYMYRVANWQIGRVAERAGVKVAKFNRKDRFAAWRKRTERKMRVAQMKDQKKKKGKKRA